MGSVLVGAVKFLGVGVTQLRRVRLYQAGFVCVTIMAAKVINMPIIYLKFCFKDNQKVKALVAACASIQQQAVDFAIDNNKTATFTIIKALYPSLKAQHPNLHTLWLQSSVRSGNCVSPKGDCCD
jgi:predicted hydrolase (HD superfamily)